MDSDLGAIVDGPSAEDLGQSLVFTNSHHNGRTATHSYAHATANSYAHAASGGTTYAHAALVQYTNTLTQTLETPLFVTTLTYCISVFISFFGLIRPSSPRFWALVLGPWMHPSSRLPRTWGHRSNSMGLGWVRGPVRCWPPPATVAFPKMQGHLQYKTLLLHPLPLWRSRHRELKMAPLLPNTVGLCLNTYKIQNSRTNSAC